MQFANLHIAPCHGQAMRIFLDPRLAQLSVLVLYCCVELHTTRLDTTKRKLILHLDRHILCLRKVPDTPRMRNGEQTKPRNAKTESATPRSDRCNTNIFKRGTSRTVFVSCIGQVEPGGGVR